MKKRVTTEEVMHIADLSRLAFTDAECEAQREHLEKVLGYFETLDGVDIADVPPTAHILDAVNVLREDEVEPSFDNAELVANAPERDDGAYVVPRVVD